MTTPTTLPSRLRALHAYRRPHFTPFNADGTPREQAFAIVATEERLAALVEAATMLDGYAEGSADVARLTNELDVLLNGDAAAPQASLCDLVAQVRRMSVPVVTCPDLTAAEVAEMARELRDGAAMPLVPVPNAGAALTLSPEQLVEFQRYWHSMVREPAASIADPAPEPTLTVAQVRDAVRAFDAENADDAGAMAFEREGMRMLCQRLGIAL